MRSSNFGNCKRDRLLTTMPPSQRSSGKSADELSNSESGRLSSKYIDIDIGSDMVVGKGRASHTRSDHARHQKGNGAKELHINLQIEVGDRRFYLHTFPLLSKSSKLNRLVFESRNTEKDLRIVLSDVPGGAQAFEFLVRHFYGGKVELSPHNVAAIRCAAEYLEVTDEGSKNNLVSRIENYLNYEVADSWRDSLAVLKSCADGLAPWAEDLEIVRRCCESIAWKCTEVTRKSRSADWWFDDVCSLSIDAFTQVIHAVTAKGYSSVVASAVVYYAERWLQLTKGSDMSTTMKLTPSESPRAASFMAFTGFNQDIVAKDAKQTQHKNRAILQGIVNLLPAPDSNNKTLNPSFLLKLLRVACVVNAGSFCKTDLARRIASQLEKASLPDLLIPAAGDATYDVDAVTQIVEFYVHDQSYGNSPPLSPRTSSVTSASSASRSGRSISSTSDSASESVTTESRSGRSISSNSDSGSASSSFSDTGSSRSGSSSNLSYRRSGSFSSTSSTSSESSEVSGSDSETTTTTTSSRSSASGVSSVSSDESVKLETKKNSKAFYVTESSDANRKTLLPPTTANFKVAQLLETYLEEVAKDSNIEFGQFMKLAELFTEFPRDSDDSIYRAIDGFLRAHPSLTDTERKSLCHLMDTGALSLAACVHAASNERLPLRVIVQLLFSEQIKLRNEMTGNEVINEKDLGSKLPSFSTSTTSTSSSTESSSGSSDGSNSSSSLSSGSSGSTSASSSTRTSRGTRKSRSIRKSGSLSSASEPLNQLAITSTRSPSVASSQLLGGLSVKETLRFVLAEIESLRKSVQEIETVKSRLCVMETLQLEMENLSTKFQEMSQDYVGMTLQVEELTKNSKHKSGWSSGWKKVTKTFQSKDNHDHTTPPLPPLKLLTDVPDLPVLQTSKSDTLRPKTPRADTKTTARADSLPVTKTTATTKSDSITLMPRTEAALQVTKTDSTIVKALKVESKAGPDSVAVNSKTSTPRGLKKEITELVQTPPRGLKKEIVELVQTPQGPKKEFVETPRDSASFKVTGQEIVVKSETSSKQDIAASSETSFKGKEGYAITAHRSHHVEDVHRRSVLSPSPSPASRSHHVEDMHRRFVRSRSPSPGARHHHKDSDSVTSMTSYSTLSSVPSAHRHQRRGDSHERRQAEKSSGHHRKHRHKEGSHNGRHSMDSRRSPATHSVHHRYKDGSVGSHHTKEGSEHHSGSHRSGHGHHKEHHSHRRRHQSFSDDSGASSDFVAAAPRRRQHRT